MIDSTAKIDPSAKISDKAVIGANVVIKENVIIEDDVTIGEGCVIEPFCVFRGPTVIGKRNHFYQFCSIGEACQDLKYNNEPTRLVIGDDNEIFKGEFKCVHPVSDCFPAEIHVCRRLQQEKSAAFERSFRNTPVSVGFKNDIGCLRPGIQYHKTHVVSGIRVFCADISQTDYQKCVHTAD